MRHTHFTTVLTFTCITCCLIAVAGCDTKSERFNLSGAVTYHGKSVTSGRIIFEPDMSKGHDGPQGVAIIKDGRYSTDKFGRGAVSGPLIVRIMATMGTNDEKETPDTPLLTYTTTIDLPKETSTFDFEMFDEKQKVKK